MRTLLLVTRNLDLVEAVRAQLPPDIADVMIVSEIDQAQFALVCLGGSERLCLAYGHDTSRGWINTDPPAELVVYPAGYDWAVDWWVALHMGAVVAEIPERIPELLDALNSAPVAA